MGKKVEIPKYDFQSGTLQEGTGNIFKLPGKSVLIIEGIFGLHPIFLDALSGVPCFKVLTTPFSGVRIDNLHIIPERKLRLLRTVARCAARNQNLGKVLQKFSSVAAAEEANVLAFRQTADAVFDSALHYELGVIKSATLGSLIVAEKALKKKGDASQDELA